MIKIFTKKINIIPRTVLYLFIAAIFFLLFVNLMQFPEITAPKKDEPASYNLDKVELETNKTLSDFEKIEDKALDAYFGIEPSGKNDKENISYFNGVYNYFVFFEYVFDNNNIVIPLIYILIVITFLLQALLLSCSNHYQDLLKIKFFNEKKLDNIFLYSSEWAVNAPPVLGVVGTIFSFGMVVSNLSDMSSLSTVFKENFANAALTTIIGGSVYVKNLGMTIFIAKNLVHLVDEE